MLEPAVLSTFVTAAVGASLNVHTSAGALACAAATCRPAREMVSPSHNNVTVHISPHWPGLALLPVVRVG